MVDRPEIALIATALALSSAACDARRTSPPETNADAATVLAGGDAGPTISSADAGGSDARPDAGPGDSGPLGAVIARASLPNAGGEADGFSSDPSITTGGRFVVFHSAATNLVVDDRNGSADVFVRDTCRGGPAACTPRTTRVSVADDGREAQQGANVFGVLHHAAASADGRRIAFISDSRDLVAGDTNNRSDVFVRDFCAPEAAGCVERTWRVSVGSNGEQGAGGALHPAISPDGRFVAFVSTAEDLVAGDANGRADLFLRDTCFEADGCTPSTIRVNVDSSGAESRSGIPESLRMGTAISRGGRYVVFESRAPELVAGDSNEKSDVFIRDTCAGAGAGCTPSTTRVSVASDGSEATGDSLAPAISESARFIAFLSQALNLVPDDTNADWDVFVRDTCIGAAAACTPSTIRVSLTDDGRQGSSIGDAPSISADGRFVAFMSVAQLVPSDFGLNLDVFVRDTCAGSEGPVSGCRPATSRVSLTTRGEDRNGTTGTQAPALSPDGRLAAFNSGNAMLIDGDGNMQVDILIATTGHR